MVNYGRAIYIYKKIINKKEKKIINYIIIFTIANYLTLLISSLLRFFDKPKSNSIFCAMMARLIMINRYSSLYTIADRC